MLSACKHSIDVRAAAGRPPVEDGWGTVDPRPWPYVSRHPFALTHESLLLPPFGPPPPPAAAAPARCAPAAARRRGLLLFECWRSARSLKCRECIRKIGGAANHAICYVSLRWEVAHPARDHAHLDGKRTLCQQVETQEAHVRIAVPPYALRRSTPSLSPRAGGGGTLRLEHARNWQQVPLAQRR